MLPPFQRTLIYATVVFFLTLCHVQSTSTSRASTTTTATTFDKQTLASFRSQAHRISQNIVHHANPLHTILNNLAALEEKILSQHHNVQHQASAQKKSCTHLTRTVQQQLDGLRVKSSRVQKKATEVDATLRAAAQAKQEKTLLLFQLQEQGVGPTVPTTALQRSTAALDRTMEQDAAPEAKPIQIVTSSLEAGKTTVTRLQSQRAAAYAAVEDVKERVSVTTRHAAALAQECAQQSFVMEELKERLEDRGKSVHAMLEAVHAKRLNIKIFLDEAKRASGGARLPQDLIDSAHHNGGCLWACTRYKKKDGTVVNVAFPKKSSGGSGADGAEGAEGAEGGKTQSMLPTGATCLKCSEDGVDPLPAFVVQSMTGNDHTVTAIKTVTEDLQTMLSTHALEALQPSHALQDGKAATHPLAALLNNNPNTGVVTHLDSTSIRRTHETAVTSIQHSHTKALAQIKRAVTMAYLHQATTGSNTTTGKSPHDADDDTLSDALAVAREGAAELLHATHDEAVARIQSEHQAALNKISATQQVALQSMGAFGAGSERIATANKIKAQHALAIQAVVAKHQATMKGISARVQKHHEQTTQAVRTIRATHAATARSIDDRHAHAIGAALAHHKQGKAEENREEQEEATLLPAALHGVQGNAVLIPALGLELALDSSLLRCRFGLNVDVEGSRVLRLNAQEHTRLTYLKCVVPEWTPTLNGGQSTVAIVGSIDGGKQWFGKGQVAVTYGIPFDGECDSTILKQHTAKT